MRVSDCIVDPEFENLLPPLSIDERTLLEDEILDYGGVHDPIITWNGVIVDGHNRYHICLDNGIEEIPSIEQHFDSKDAAKVFIIEHQLGRRNIPDYIKGQAALQLEPLFAAEAKRRMSEGGGDKKSGTKNSAHPIENTGETREKVAQAAGMSHDTIRKIKTIETETVNGNPVAVRERKLLMSGEKKSINDAYKKVIAEKKQTKSSSHRIRTKDELFADDGRRICKHCNEPINVGDAYDHHPNVHKRCANEKRKQYKDASHDLLNNVAVFSTETLIRELTSSADMLRESWEQSIIINESMGVKLTAAEKKRLSNAVENLIAAIQKIEERD